ncbi:hypothetical protein Peur_015786 [Populus x canadensis]
MRRTKTRAGRSSAVAASSSSSEDDISLGASQEEAPTPPAPSTDAASSSGTSQRRGGVPSQRNQFTRNYEAQWKDDLSMFTNIEAARVISSAFKSSMEIPLFQWSQISKHPEWMPQINAWFNRFKAASLGREPSPMELFVETHVRSQDRQKGVQQFVDNHAQHFETYNNRLRERYEDDILTHPEFDPDLWIEQHTTQLTEKYDNLKAEYAQLKVSHAQQRAKSEQLKTSQAQQKTEYEAAHEQQKAAYEQLREMIMNMSNSGTCAPNLFWPYNHQPPPGSPPPPPAPPLY